MLLARVLENSSAELKRLVLLVHEIEAAVFDGTVAREAHLSAGLHNLDVVIQTLSELAGVFSRLAEVAPEGAMADAPALLGPVRLALLRQALARQVNALPVQEPNCAGKVELF